MKYRVEVLADKSVYLLTKTELVKVFKKYLNEFFLGFPTVSVIQINTVELGKVIIRKVKE